MKTELLNYFGQRVLEFKMEFDNHSVAMRSVFPVIHYENIL